MILKNQLNNFKKNKFAIVKFWINKQDVLNVLNTCKIDKELFIKRYAFGLLDYYIEMINNDCKIKESVIINDFLKYLYKHHIKIEQLLILLLAFKNAVIEYIIEIHSESLEIISEINYYFDDSFKLFMRIYSKTLNQVELALSKSVDVVDKHVILSRTDTKGKILKVSTAFCNVSGYTSEELIGKDHNILRHPDMPKELFLDLWNTIKEGKEWHGEIKNLKKDGSFYWVETSIHPNFDNMGQIISFDAIRQDVSSKKLIESQQNLLIEQSKSAAMGEMIAMIAHQWRQPLQAVSILIQKLPLSKMIEGKISDELIEKVVSDVGFQLQYMSKTIDDFRDYFKPNKLSEIISISLIVNKSVDFLAYMFKFSDIKLNLDNNIDEEIRIYTNEIVQVIINIIKNSCDALIENKIENKTISVGTYLEDDCINITIEDNAGGIPDNIIGKIFEPYFSTKSNKNGTGLGLYMSKNIVEQHSNGLITVENTDVGAKFTIKLPLK
jgi:PAS domain S-box-containing protein